MCRNLTSALAGLLLVFLSTSVFPQAKSGSSAALEAASAQLARNNVDGAEHTAWAVLSEDPNNARALLLLGAIRERQHRYPEAEALYRRVLQLDPSSSDAGEQVGRVLALQNRNDEALPFLQQAFEKQKGIVSLAVELARVYVAQNKFAESVATLAPIPAARLPVAAIPVKASGLLGTGKEKDAAALIPRVASSPAIALDLAEVFVNHRLPDLALRCIAQAEKSAKTARLYYLKGMAEGLKGDSVLARRDLKAALIADPRSVPALMGLADLAEARQQYTEAVEQLQRALAIEPDSLPVLRRLIQQALNASLHGLVEEKAYELARKSNELDDRYLVAAVLLQEKEYQEAARILEAYLKERPDDSKAYFGLGLALLNQQNYAEARAALERALELDPSLVDAEYSLGVLFSKEGDNERAAELFRRVLEKNPRHARALLDAGALYLQDGQLEKAKSSLEASEALDPSNPDTHYQLSLLYNRMGNSQLAQGQMERFRALKQTRKPGMD